SILAYQRYVRSGKSGDERYIPAVLGHDLLRHICRGGAGTGIVYVAEVSCLVQDPVYQRPAHGACTWREVEQRICRSLYFVIKYVGVKAIEADGLLVSGKMYHMPLVRQRFPQFCRQHTATPVSRVANYSNAHPCCGFYELLSYIF